MKCRQCSRLISDSLDRSLGIIEKGKMFAHLLCCSDCTHFRDNLKILRKLAREFPGNAPSDGGQNTL